MAALHQSTAVTGSSVTPLLEAAAEFELRANAAEQRAQAEERDNQLLRQRLDLSQLWLLAIRKSHRTKSHAATGKLISLAIAACDPTHPVVVPLF
jgi:hypothetical protein